VFLFADDGRLVGGFEGGGTAEDWERLVARL
jgi:hypothetical protein